MIRPVTLIDAMKAAIAGALVRALLPGLLALACLIAGARLPARAAEPVPAAWAGALAGEPGWAAYRTRFVAASGRVVDTGNGGISHSEGQGYGMLLAVAAGDREAFERIWGWTRANLMVRDDQLLAWRWEPDRRPGVADMNDAADGDILVAWALVEAADAWGEPAHRMAARRVAVELGRKLILARAPGGPLLLPGVAGFSAEERADGPVVNLSYWIFPAFPRLAAVAPEFPWAGLGRSGQRLLAQARFGTAGLPVEWTALHAARSGPPRPAEGFPPHFAYNALRIPLYLAMAGIRERALYAPFLALWSQSEGGLPLVDVESGRTTERLAETGYAAIPALAACAVQGTPVPRALRAVRAESEHYYPATLHLLALAGLATRFPECVLR
ncbi:glycosyl hydrolase family 8 [Methylobacterium dankookense]|uniref:cellulase n=1 Tax=Methylobacterium dankookense TaxID=560405 RepID=A0A564G6L3_9HYPH|nr:glycosyl hydrolase family 8 [Methylobacterium dankookense]GJD55382.1 Minor endoglucanase Y [Methylobacterium dankookense]VUF15676.1 Minor endoglucanase Y [Methylobacterium dankookense]